MVVRGSARARRSAARAARAARPRRHAGMRAAASRFSVGPCVERHHHVGGAVLFPEAVDLDQRRMVELRQQPRLVDEAAQAGVEGLAVALRARVTCRSGRRAWRATTACTPSARRARPSACRAPGRRCRSRLRRSALRSRTPAVGGRSAAGCQRRRWRWCAAIRRRRSRLGFDQALDETLRPVRPQPRSKIAMGWLIACTVALIGAPYAPRALSPRGKYSRL